MTGRAACAAVALCLGILGAAPASAQHCLHFTDVSGSDPFCADITWLQRRAITLGCTADKYCPDAPVYRSQMAAFLHRAALAAGPTLHSKHETYTQGAVPADGRYCASAYLPAPPLSVVRALEVEATVLVQAGAADSDLMTAIFYEYFPPAELPLQNTLSRRRVAAGELGQTYMFGAPSSQPANPVRLRLGVTNATSGAPPFEFVSCTLVIREVDTAAGP